MIELMTDRNLQYQERVLKVLEAAHEYVRNSWLQGSMTDVADPGNRNLVSELPVTDPAEAAAGNYCALGALCQANYDANSEGFEGEDPHAMDSNLHELMELYGPGAVAEVARAIYGPEYEKELSETYGDEVTHDSYTGADCLTEYGIIAFNDAVGREHCEVEDVFDSAIINVMEKIGDIKTGKVEGI